MEGTQCEGYGNPSSSNKAPGGPSRSGPGVLDRAWIEVWADAWAEPAQGFRQPGESALSSAEIIPGAMEVECDGMRVALVGLYAALPSCIFGALQALTEGKTE